MTIASNQTGDQTGDQTRDQTGDHRLIPVTVYSDVICPWCYVGKRRLEAALEALTPRPHVALSWRPFELNPDMPSNGIERTLYRTQKFGAERAVVLDQNMMRIGDEVGISFAFDKMLRTPNTRLAHRLIWQAGEVDLATQNRLVDLLFKAYFEDALDIGDRAELTHIAVAAGLAGDLVKHALESEVVDTTVRHLETEGRGMGIQGVPYFILIDKYALSGAQPVDVWAQALPQVMQELEQT
jgi:predicted DsbA family dithiol-disulfide isomerase